MPRIDRLIQAFVQSRAERLVLATGEKIVLVTGADRRAASPQPITTQQIQELLAEIAPPGALDAGEPGGREFPYASPAGPVLIRFSRSDGSLSLEARLAAPAPAGAGKAALTIESLFVKMVKEGCSDLHLTAGNPPLFRKHGEMVNLESILPFAPEQVRELLLSITPPAMRDEFERSHDVDFSHEIPGVARFRCNLFLDRKGMGGVFRVIPTRIATAADLELPPQILDLCNLNKGLVVVTGPTGSGKSTTLAAMIDHINRNEAVHIITIEDPIEFVHPPLKALINQREIGHHTAGFKPALRAALREDPDIVLVGEMRDLETVAIAIETAETGHLVFGTLHTNTAPSTVDRIIDQFPADRQNQVRTMLSESLKGVIAQTLCRKKGGGRVAALEILLINPAVSNLIREGKTFQIPSIMQAGRGAGMITLSDALIDLVKRDLVEPDEAYANAVNKQEFRSVLERNGLKLRAA
ncbi:MAG: type IV pilus twitching motility protein PilT [Candidatus Polarisedimenticolia bacterium]